MKIDQNLKKAGGFDSSISILSGSPLLFSQLCQTEARDKIGHFSDSKVFYNTEHKNSYRPFDALKLCEHFSFEVYFEKIKVVFPSGPWFKMGRGRISFE